MTLTTSPDTLKATLHQGIDACTAAGTPCTHITSGADLRDAYVDLLVRAKAPISVEVDAEGRSFQRFRGVKWLVDYTLPPETLEFHVSSPDLATRLLSEHAYGWRPMAEDQ